MTPSKRSKPSNERSWQPHLYQRRGVKFLLEHAAAGLLLDPGMGKTSITLAAFKILKQKRIANKALVIAPLRPCHKVWPAELAKWSDFEGLSCVVLHGKDKDQLLKQDADLYVVNYEGLDWLLQTDKTKGLSGKTKVAVDKRRFKALGFDTLICDELSMLKHTTSNRYKAMKEIADTFQRRWGLTGTPAANGLMGLFGQCYVLDQGRTFGQYITHYRLKYFNLGRDGFTWTLKEGAEKLIYQQLKPLMLRMAADDYLDLPQLRFNHIKVELPPAAKKIYQELSKDLITKLDSGTVTAANAAVASGKLRQVANGALYLDKDTTELFKDVDPKKQWVELHTAKLDALDELIDELQGQQLMVVYDFQHDLERLQIRHKNLPFIGGGVSTARSNELQDQWNSGELPVLYVHPQAVAYGLNLQGSSARHMVIFSPMWNYELFLQLIYRLRRQGSQADWINIHQLICEDTVDEDILVSQSMKDHTQQALFAALKARLRRK